MSEFVNTIDLLGDDVCLVKAINQTLSEFNDDKITKIRKYCFYSNKSIQKINLPNVTSVGESAFNSCSELIEVDFPFVKTGNQSILNSCPNLITANLPSATYMSAYGFQNCTNLKNVDLSSATILEDSVFYGCSSLIELDLPNIERIANAVFNGCSSLKTLIIRTSTLCTLANTNSFTNTPISSGTGYIYVPRALIDSYKSATNWSTYAAQFRVLEDYTVDGTTTGEFVMPSMTRKLVDGSIVHYSNENATNVRDYAFYGCSNLTTVDLPNVTSIEDNAFYECSNLTTVDLSSTASIGKYAFYKCANLTKLILRSDTMCTLLATNTFNNTPISSGTGYIYVPRALVDTYKSATNWTVYANQFRALEDYTVDGTITGELDPNKI